MKQLILIRHAKSSWADTGQKDFDRPLNDRGHRDAETMAIRLIKKNIRPDAFITSPAKRALTTCEYFAAAFKFFKDTIIKKQELYLAEIATFYSVISKLDNDLDTVLLCSHNEGITQFANTLTRTRVDSMPTCSVFGVSAAIKHWNTFKEAEKEFLFFYYPKDAG